MAALASFLVWLSPPADEPAPPPSPTTILLPTYTTQGDGTRLECSPNGSYCWEDTTGLPSYLS